MENLHHTDTNQEGNSKTESFMCRQTSARWTPTAEQIRILRELYYGAGVRSPTAEQIQKISAWLRQYGNLEGKNVFYWFQNHKARERHRKRFGINTTTSSSSTSSSPYDHHHHHHAKNSDNTHDHLLHTKSPNFSKGYYHASSGSECMINAANVQLESYGYGSVNMERHFRDCSISHIPIGRAFMDHRCYNFLKNPKPLIDLEGPEEDDYEGAGYVNASRRTLPLFPMHGEDQVNGGRFFISNGSPYASLELSLNSYTGVTPD